MNTKISIIFHILLAFAGPAQAVALKPHSAPFIRANQQINQMKLSPKGRYLAYTDDTGLGLNVLDLNTKDIYRVTEAKVGLSFFWTPDGFRLFYRELVRPPLKPAHSDQERELADLDRDAPIESKIKAFDCSVARNIEIDKIARSSGYLTFDPRDLRFLLMSESGIHTKKIYIPNQRLALWQIAGRHERGKWLATQKGILWVTQGGLSLRRMEDDQTELESFDISPDGQWIAWGTKGNKIYASREGKKPEFIDYGREPRWHPTRHIIVFAGARMVGNKPVNFDLKIADSKGQSKFLTSTQYSSERSPQWHKGGDKLLYTVENTTDLYLMDFRP